MKTKTDPGTRILAQNVRVSNDTRLTGLNNNDLIAGSAGAGKTGGYVAPNLHHPTGSLVVSDTKGQLAKRFGKELKDKGYLVQVIDLVNPMKSCGYNPLFQIRRYRNGTYREQDVLTLAHSLVPMMDKDEPFWENAARAYLGFLISYCLEVLPKKEQTLLSILELHRAFIRPGGELPFLKWLDENPDSFPAKKYDEMKSMKPADRMWASIMGMVNVALEPYGFQEARHIFGKSRGFDIRTLGKRKTVLFLNVSDTDRTFDPLVNIFYTQTLQTLCSEADRLPEGHLQIPVRIIMDDFATSARIEDFDKIISVIRSRDISVSLILQSLTQLENMYGHPAATTILDNCDHILYLGTQNMETAEFIGCRAYKTPETILCMPNENAWLLTKGEAARLVKKVLPYQLEEEEEEAELS